MGDSNTFLADAFGLPSFVSPAIQRESVRQRLEKQLTPRPVAPSTEKRKRIGTVAGWAAGITIPLAVAALLYFSNPTLVDNLGDAYASFVPTVKFTSAETHKTPGKSNTHTDLANFRILPEKLDEKAVPAPATSVQPEPSVPSLPERYQVVVGSFADETNAGKYVSELRSRSYNANIVGTNSSGLFRVSIGGSDTRREALSLLAAIREKENPSAWLLRVR